MKIINKLSYALMATALIFTACENEPKNDGPGKDPEAKELVLSVNKESIMADGRDKAVFTVKYNDVDVTTAAVIKNGNSEISGYNFTSTEAGEYIFTATYTDPETQESKISNEVKVTVSSLVLSVEPATLAVNGTAAAIFTVTFQEKDVTADATITNVTLNEEMGKGEHEFSSPGYIGEFKFQAKYANLESNVAIVTVGEPMAQDLRLVVSKGRATVGEEVTFTVLNKGTDVTANAKIKNITDDGYLTGNKFAPASEGTTEFVAEYEDKVSQTLSVGTGMFHKNVMALKFTSVGCGYCPMMATALEKSKALFPNRIVEIAVHNKTMGPDPMVPSNVAEYNSQFKMQTTNIPATYYDMMPDILSPGAEAAAAILGKVKPLAKTTAGVGIAASSSVNGSAVTVDVNVTAYTPNTYYLAVQLLENGIVYKQSSGGDKYVHNHTLRKTASASVFGDSLDAMAENQQISKQYTITVEDPIKVNNCKVVCYVCYKEGDIWQVANIVELPVDGWVDYAFE